MKVLLAFLGLLMLMHVSAINHQKHHRLKINRHQGKLMSNRTRLDKMKIVAKAAPTEIITPTNIWQCRVGDGSSFRGPISKTKTGRLCQSWSEQSPQKHTRTPESYPLEGLEDNNYCRNPDHDEAEPWCYTTDPNERWEHCGIPECETDCQYMDGANYRGEATTSNSGLECMEWNSDNPHLNTRHTDNYPKAGIEENYVRNPDGEPALWCYTVDPRVRWEYADIGIARCAGETPAPAEGEGQATGSGVGSGAGLPAGSGAGLPAGSGAGVVNNLAGSGAGLPVDNTVPVDNAAAGSSWGNGAGSGAGVNNMNAGSGAGVVNNAVPVDNSVVNNAVPADNGVVNNAVPADNGVVNNAAAAGSWGGGSWAGSAAGFLELEESVEKHGHNKHNKHKNGNNNPTGSMGGSFAGGSFAGSTGGAVPPTDGTVPPATGSMGGTATGSMGGMPAGSGAGVVPPADGTVPPATGSMGGMPAGSGAGVAPPADGTVPPATGSMGGMGGDVPPPPPPSGSWSGDAGSGANPTADMASTSTIGPVARDEVVIPDPPYVGYEYNFSKCQIGDGRMYEGTKAETRTKIECQPWSEQFPHNHTMVEDYPDADLKENYCRNPDGMPGVWCYTTDPNTRRMFCDVPTCPGVVPANGGPVQNLDQVEEIMFTIDEMRNRAVPGLPPYTSEDRFTLAAAHLYNDVDVLISSMKEENADVQLKASQNIVDHSVLLMNIVKDAALQANDPVKTLMDTTPADCELTGATFYFDRAGNKPVNCSDMYTASLCDHYSIVRKNCPCKCAKVVAQDPVVTANLATSNCQHGNGMGYRGDIAQTRSGLDCMRWDSQDPHKHTRKPEDYPFADLQENYCRNPDGEPTAWCYTTDINVRWEYCNIPVCEGSTKLDDAPEFFLGREKLAEQFDRIYSMVDIIKGVNGWPGMDHVRAAVEAAKLWSSSQFKALTDEVSPDLQQILTQMEPLLPVAGTAIPSNAGNADTAIALEKSLAKFKLPIPSPLEIRGEFPPHLAKLYGFKLDADGAVIVTAEDGEMPLHEAITKGSSPETTSVDLSGVLAHKKLDTANPNEALLKQQIQSRADNTLKHVKDVIAKGEEQSTKQDEETEVQMIAPADLGGEGDGDGDGDGADIPTDVTGSFGGSTGSTPLPAPTDAAVPPTTDASVPVDAAVPPTTDATVPVDGAGQAPADGAGQAPADGAGQAPADGAGQAPVDGAEQAPADGAEQAPADGAEQAPADGAATTDGADQSKKTDGADQSKKTDGAATTDGAEEAPVDGDAQAEKTDGSANDATKKATDTEASGDADAASAEATEKKKTDDTESTGENKKKNATEGEEVDQDALAAADAAAGL